MYYQPGPSDESSQFNGRRFRSRLALAVGVISLPAAPRTATPVRFDFCSDENSSEVRTTLRESARNYGRPFGALGRVDIISSTAQLGPPHEADGLRELCSSVPVPERAEAVTGRWSRLRLQLKASEVAQTERRPTE
jgi:hypothetical protein